MAHDLVIKGGTVIDGTGAPARTADVAIDGDRIVEVGSVSGVDAARVVDADGALVTPGFVDIHTHYDGQATWEERLIPSAWHGVTTVVMGNCGVGFAPVRRSDRDRLVELMEGVEDIPGTALHEGLSWEWESFAQYLDELEKRPHDIDFATQVPHGALRLYVMGERGARLEPADEGDVAEMGRLAAEAIAAGALGFSTSRTRNHKSSKGEPTPSLRASEGELSGIAEAMGVARAGVLEVVSDFVDVESEFAMLRRIVERSGRPMSISVARAEVVPTQWRRLLDLMASAQADGLEMRAQVAARAVGVLFGLQASVNPFLVCSSYRAIAGLPLAERVERMRTDEVRSAILAEHRSGEHRNFRPERMFLLGDPPNYEPDLDDSLAAVARRSGRPVEEVVYDALLEDGGRAFLYVPFLNYDGSLDAVREMLLADVSVAGLGDGGAHVGTICDASFPTTLLAHWGRDRSPGPRLELPLLVKRQTKDTAVTVGLLDRGVLAPGYKADVNVIDFESLQAHRPAMSFDLPAGGKRLLQKADGYKHTFVSGKETYTDGQPTDELPGRLIRGAQGAPR